MVSNTELYNQWINWQQDLRPIGYGVVAAGIWFALMSVAIVAGASLDMLVDVDPNAMAEIVPFTALGVGGLSAGLKALKNR